MHAFFPVTASQVLLSMQRAAAERTNIPPARLTTVVVGHLLGQLGLAQHRNTHLRSWSLTPAQLSRLARAFGVGMPPELAEAIAQATPSPPGA